MSSPTSSLRADVQALRDAEDLDVLIIGGGINGLATLRDLALQVSASPSSSAATSCPAPPRFQPHGARRHPLPRERRVPSREGGGHRAQRPAQDGPPLRQAARDHHPDLQDVLRHPVRPVPPAGDARSRKAQRARRPADQGRPHHVRHLLPRRRQRPPSQVPGQEEVARGAAEAQQRPRLHRDVLRRVDARPRAHRARRAARRHRGRRRAHPGGQLRLGGRRRRQRRARARRGLRRGVQRQGQGHPEHRRSLDRPGERGHGPQDPVHGRHQGLAHRARQPRAAGRDRWARDLLRALRRRIVLIYPLKDRVLVGTTDIDADPSKPVVCTDDEIAYFFDLIGHVFPTVGVDRSQIVYTFSASVRSPATTTPLPASSRATTASSKTRSPASPR